MKDQSFLQKCYHCFGKEFKRSNFKLDHVPVDDFYISQVNNDNNRLFSLSVLLSVCLDRLVTLHITRLLAVIYFISANQFFVIFLNWNNWTFVFCTILSRLLARLLSASAWCGNLCGCGSHLWLLAVCSDDRVLWK